MYISQHTDKQKAVLISKLIMRLILFGVLALLAISRTQAIGPVDCFRPNEEYSCGSACQTLCENYWEECPVINIRCNDACYCKEGYARDDTGTCIKHKFCDERKCGICGENEEYRCSNYYDNECRPQLLSYVSANDTFGCFCKKGFKRDSCGNCIAEIDCSNYQHLPIDCSRRPNEHYECGSACQTTCENVGLKCPIINIQCNHGCYCNEGYARNGSGICIKRKKCPNNKCTCPNEHYETCGSPCQTECATLGQECNIVNIKCNNACYCDFGYARNSKGTCIPIRKCPKKKKTKYVDGGY